MSIKWNEVTWYSRLLAILFFIGVFPFVSYEIGRQMSELDSTASNPMYVETTTTTVVYKDAFMGGQIPSSWSEYGNGFGTIATPVNDEKVITGAGGETYARYVIDSVSPSPIMFSDVPYARVDVFSITPQLQAKLIAKAQAANTYTRQTIGQNEYDVISMPDKAEGSPAAQYIRTFSSPGGSSSEVKLFIVYQSDSASFRKGVARLLATLGSATAR